MSTKILLQTTIPFAEDDWHIGRFAMLAEYLERFDGGRRFSVTGRDRTPDATGHDPVLRDLSRHHFDQVWVFGVDGGGDKGLAPPEVEGLRRFHLAGGGLMLTRDHHDMGCALSHIAEVGAAQCWHSVTPEEDTSRHCDDDDSPSIGWPNYHSGQNGAYQNLETLTADHPLLDGVRWLPAHPHEGALRVTKWGQAIARGRSQRTHRDFLLIVAFDLQSDGTARRAVAHSSFHHFADYNIEPDVGAPTFVTDPVAPLEARHEEGAAHTRRYWANLASWLGAS